MSAARKAALTRAERSIQVIKAKKTLTSMLKTRLADMQKKQALQKERARKQSKKRKKKKQTKKAGGL